MDNIGVGFGFETIKYKKAYYIFVYIIIVLLLLFGINIIFKDNVSYEQEYKNMFIVLTLLNIITLLYLFYNYYSDSDFDSKFNFIKIILIITSCSLLYFGFKTLKVNEVNDNAKNRHITELDNDDLSIYCILLSSGILFLEISFFIVRFSY